MHLSQPAVTERVRKLEASGVISGYRATVDLSKLGYGIRAIIRIGRADYPRVAKLIQQTPEVVSAYNVTGEDSWILEIAVIDVMHLDAVLTKFCILTETSTSIILNVARQHQAMAPARNEALKREYGRGEDRCSRKSGTIALFAPCAAPHSFFHFSLCRRPAMRAGPGLRISPPSRA